MPSLDEQAWNGSLQFTFGYKLRLQEPRALGVQYVNLRFTRI